MLNAEFLGAVLANVNEPTSDPSQPGTAIARGGQEPERTASGNVEPLQAQGSGLSSNGSFIEKVEPLRSRGSTPDSSTPVNLDFITHIEGEIICPGECNECTRPQSIEARIGSDPDSTARVREHVVRPEIGETFSR